jgi:threonine aldolase
LDFVQFGSDNYSGICPESLDCLIEANAGYHVSYGDDGYTAKAADQFRELFETDCEVFFVFNGTAANSLSLASLCQSYHSIICHKLAHIEADECGGPEFFSNGSKILVADGREGKLDDREALQLITKRSDIHYPKPKVISVTQSTELGTVYTPDELRQFHQLARDYDLKLHMDGARFANAVASLNVSPAELSWKVGVDVLCFGGAKNGLPIGEAVIFFDRDLAEDFAYRCKQAGQLASKMRYLSAPWLGLLQDDVWLKNARHANESAQYLAAELSKIPGIELRAQPQANAVFFGASADLLSQLREQGWVFYTFIGEGTARLICSWNTRKEAIDKLIDTIRNLSV